MPRSQSTTPLFAIALLLVAGCNLVGPNRHFDVELEHYKQISKTVEYADALTPPSIQAEVIAPHTIRNNVLPTSWEDLTVEQAIHMALANSSVLRDLGGTILRYPDTTRTIMDPAVVTSDPRFGIEGALSEFDAQVATSVVAEKNDRQVNNFVASGGTRLFQQDLVNFQSQISKVTATGTQFTLRGLSTYDLNNASFNKFPSVWDSIAEAEFRQPMLQGAGTRFNRLAGPESVPGYYNGVLIARVNTDVSTAEFEVGIRDLVSNVENAYWDLYFAYRDLDARIQARNTSLEVWKSIAVMRLAEQAGGKPEREAQAREQYFRYEEEVQNSLAGKLQDATTNNNGSSGGSFRGTGGVLVCERRLRLAMGLPINEERMLRPIDDPTLARIDFDWGSASDDAVARRPELHRQRLVVKRREMEYVASRNFLLPRLDIVGRYRYRGLGKGLIGDVDLPPNDPDPSFENSSLANLFGGDYQEWLLGGEVSFPIGYRQAYAGVRNAQLNLAREKAVLEEQERQIIHDLSNAIADMDRAYEVMRSSYNRLVAGTQNVELVRAAIAERPDVNPEQLLDAARRLAEADLQYQKALVEHMLAIKNVHFEKGTLLEYDRVQFADQLSGASLPPATARPLEPTPAVPTPAAPAPQIEFAPPAEELAPPPARPMNQPAIQPTAQPAIRPAPPAQPFLQTSASTGRAAVPATASTVAPSAAAPLPPGLAPPPVHVQRWQPLPTTVPPANNQVASPTPATPPPAAPSPTTQSPTPVPSAPLPSSARTFTVPPPPIPSLPVAHPPVPQPQRSVLVIPDAELVPELLSAPRASTLPPTSPVPTYAAPRESGRPLHEPVEQTLFRSESSSRPGLPTVAPAGLTLPPVGVVTSPPLAEDLRIERLPPVDQK